jgi:hypothetical protein
MQPQAWSVHVFNRLRGVQGSGLHPQAFGVTGQRPETQPVMKCLRRPLCRNKLSMARMIVLRTTQHSAKRVA